MVTSQGFFVPKDALSGERAICAAAGVITITFSYFRNFIRMIPMFMDVIS